MADSVSKVMVSIVDSQVKNRDKSIQQLPQSEKAGLKYDRRQLIDDSKENEFVLSALDLALQGNNGWNLDEKNPDIQNKKCPHSKRKVFRIVCKNINSCDFQDVYDYLECGYRGVADFDIIHHIDSDHDILYQKIESPAPEWILSSRDCQCLRMRFYINEYYDKYSNNTYTIMGTLWYPFDSSWKDHILYIDPGKYYRICFEFGARVYYKATNAMCGDSYTYIGLQHSYKARGWIPQFVENSFGLKQKNIKYFDDLCKRIPDELKQRKYKTNARVQKPLLPIGNEKGNEDADDFKDEQKNNIYNEEEEQIRIWLRDVGGDNINMEQYLGVLMNNGFDNFNFIRGLSLDILEQIGINKIGHRIELMRRINCLEGNVDDNGDNVEDEEGQHTGYI